MRIESQHSAERAQLARLIEPMAVAMMTHVDDDGALLSEPMAPLEMDSDGALWFFTDLRSARVEHLRAVNLSFTDPERATYVSLSGRGEVHAERAHIQRLWTPPARAWFPDGPASTNLALLKFVPESAEYWDTPESRMVRLFAMAASALFARPAALGSHGKFNDLSPPAFGPPTR